MAKSKLVGVFDLDGSPLSTFNVSKAMSKARAAAFTLKPGDGKNGDQSFRKVSWNKVAPPVDLTPDPVIEDQAEPPATADTAVADDSGDPDGWDEALQSADTPAVGSAPESIPNHQTARSNLSPDSAAGSNDETVAIEGLETAVAGAADPVRAAPLNLAPAAPPVIDEAQKAKIREEAYDEGFSAGKAMTESEREAELAKRIADLERLVRALSDPELLDTAMLSAQIRQSVLSLATERAGSQIDNFPEPFLGRLETMLRNVQHMSGIRELFVSQADLDVITAGLPDHKDLSRIKMRVDNRLGRGDVKLRVGGGEISDLFKDLTPAEVPTAEIVAASDLDEAPVEHGAAGQGAVDSGAIDAPSPGATADKVAPDVAVDKAAPEAVEDKAASEAAADKAAPDVAADKAAPDAAADTAAPDAAADTAAPEAVEDEGPSKDD